MKTLVINLENMSLRSYANYHYVKEFYYNRRYKLLLLIQFSAISHQMIFDHSCFNIHLIHQIQLKLQIHRKFPKKVKRRQYIPIIVQLMKQSMLLKKRWKIHSTIIYSIKSNKATIVFRFIIITVFNSL